MILALCLFGIGCGTSGERTEDFFIQQELTKRLNVYKRIEINKCKKAILTEARDYVDSTIVSQLTLSKDTISAPPRPMRPNHPGSIILDDSTLIVPLQLD